MKRKKLYLLLWIIVWAFSLFILRAHAEAPMMTFEIPEAIAGNEIKEYSYRIVFANWGAEHWESFDRLINAESKWNPEAKNPKSTAYGLGQFLNSTWGSVGMEKTNDPEKQIEAAVFYIQDRYGDPIKAWRYWQKNYFY